MICTPVPRADKALDMRSRMRPAMGTFATIESDRFPESLALAASDAAFDVIDSIERLMHPTRAGSDLSRINQARPGEVVDVGRSTWDVLALAQRISAASGGVFDPCLATSEGCVADLELTSDHLVQLRRRVLIDLGGIAKGYAVDQALRCLREHGCENALVNIGGDMAALGADRRVGARLRERVLSLNLSNRALAVSDAQNENGPPEHRGYYSRCAQPMRRTIAAVMAPNAAIADALTKCALYCDDAEWTVLARQFDAVLIPYAREGWSG